MYKKHAVATLSVLLTLGVSVALANNPIVTTIQNAKSGTTRPQILEGWRISTKEFPWVLVGCIWRARPDRVIG